MFLHDEPWFAKPFHNFCTTTDIPTGDTYAYLLYPKYRWLYNKLQLYETLNYEAYPHEIIPNNWPVFSKPIYNLFGMGIEAKKINSKGEWKITPGHLWMPIFCGKHISTDYAMCNGEILWSYSMVGIKDKNDSFMHWSYCSNVLKHELEWIKKNLNTYTGILNVESIGKNIIEVHPRMSIQFVDLYGQDFISSVISLYEKGKWTKNTANKQGYSFVVRITKKQSIENKKIVNKINSTNTEKVYYTINKNEPLYKHIDNDVSTYRIAVVNGKNKHKCQLLTKKIKIDIKKQLSL